MRIEYFLFTIYLVLSFLLIPKIAFVRHAGLTLREIRLLLIFKILSGIAGAFYFKRIALSADSLSFNEGGKIEYELLLSNPVQFFTDFKNGMQSYGLDRLFETQHSFWADLRSILLYKFIAILDLITRGNFYFNTIIFCTIVFFGHLAFYRIYSEIYKGNKLQLLLISFCLPSVLLYTSCIHKDGVIFLCLGIIGYIFFRALSSNRLINIKYTLLFTLSMAAVFLFRNYVIVAIVPAMVAALLCKLLPYKKRFIVLATYSIFFLLFFLSGFSESFINMPAAVVQRKVDFAALGEATTNIAMNELKPTVPSFILNFPQVINHYLFRPYLWEFTRPSILLTALELFCYQLLLLAFIFYRKKATGPVHTFNIFGFAFVFNMMLVIGYTIPNIGAIVRYRSIFWVFLLCPLLCNTDWEKIPFFRKPVPGKA